MKIYYSLLLFLIIGCTAKTPSTTKVDPPKTENQFADAVSDSEAATKGATKVASEESSEILDQDSVLVPPFVIHFEFSEGVQQLLNSKKEGLVIDLMLSDLPADASKLKDKDYYNSEDEEVYLANKEVLYTPNELQMITIQDLKISKEALAALSDPNYTITVNFYSSRTSSDKNLFSTSPLIEEVNTMKNKTHTVKVKLL